MYTSNLWCVQTIFHRQHTGPYVSEVSNAIYSKVDSLNEGIALMMEMIDCKVACWV